MIVVGAIGVFVVVGVGHVVVGEFGVVGVVEGV